MHTETQCLAPITEPDSHDAGSDLIAQVHKNSRRVIGLSAVDSEPARVVTG
jgi:hypothetical protein